MPTRRTLVRQKLPCPARPRLQYSCASSRDPNTHWSERARAATWHLRSCDPVPGGEGGQPSTTPMRKLFSRLLRLALVPSSIVPEVCHGSNPFYSTAASLGRSERCPSQRG